MLPFVHPQGGTEVLYVEDQDIHVRLMRALFDRRAEQPSLHVAVDLQSALALAPTIQPSLLLLDLNLPDGDGITLLEQLRGFAHLKDVPAIAVTAEPGFEAMGTGFEEVWRKPINLQRVLERLEHWLPRRRTRVAPTVAAQPATRRASGMAERAAVLEP